MCFVNRKGYREIRFHGLSMLGKGAGWSLTTSQVLCPRHYPRNCTNRKNCIKIDKTFTRTLYLLKPRLFPDNIAHGAKHSEISHSFDDDGTSSLTKYFL